MSSDADCSSTGGDLTISTGDHILCVAFDGVDSNTVLDLTQIPFIYGVNSWAGKIQDVWLGNFTLDTCAFYANEWGCDTWPDQNTDGCWSLFDIDCCYHGDVHGKNPNDGTRPYNGFDTYNATIICADPNNGGCAGY
jgi:hypothetical protein